MRSPGLDISGAAAFNAWQEATATSAVLPLAQRRVGMFESHRTDASPGRRIRAFAGLVRGQDRGLRITLAPRGETVLELKRPISYACLLEAAAHSTKLAPLRATLGALPLRCHPMLDVEDERVEEIPAACRPSDPELHPALQDLAYQINADVSAACEAFNDPGLFYPGVDEGIEPVTDEHIKLVIWGMQRELNRERRHDAFGNILPPAPLAELPWHLQRALVERRRLRYLEWGITRESWLSNRWSLWEIPLDEEWTPGWA